MTLPASLAGLGFSVPERLETRLADAVRGEFEIERMIARGAMGVVFLARDLELERHVAIKVLLTDGFTTTTQATRFKREAQTVAALNHPNIVPVHSVREHGDLLLYIMQYVDGKTLAEHIAEGPLPFEQVVSVLSMTAAALHHAHERDIVHRDVKPANIIIDQTGRAYVMDFGIAQLPGRNDLTAAGSLVGTPTYASPEQCRAQAVGPKADQYSLGVVAYEMLTGVPPFTATSMSGIIHAHVATEAPRVGERRPDCPESLADTVGRMLAKAPEDRWPSLMDAIEYITGGASHTVTASRGGGWADGGVRGARRPRRSALVAAAVAALLVAGGIVYVVAGVPLTASTSDPGLDAPIEEVVEGDRPDPDAARPTPRDTEADVAAEAPRVADAPETDERSDAPPQRGAVMLGTRGVAAVLYVNGEPLGAASRLRSWDVEAGSVDISLRADGCVSWDTTVVVPESTELRVGYRLLRCGAPGG